MQNDTLLTPKQPATRSEITPTGQPYHAKALQQALPTLNRVAESVMVRNAG